MSLRMDLADSGLRMVMCPLTAPVDIGLQAGTFHLMAAEDSGPPMDTCPPTGTEDIGLLQAIFLPTEAGDTGPPVRKVVARESSASKSSP